jgi:c-di-GMP-binding flagellar brake protein YcgR
MPDNGADRRREQRVEFSYLCQFKVLSPKPTVKSFTGYLQDISMGGACVQFEDKYGLFPLNVNEVESSRIKLTVKTLKKDPLIVFAVVRWIRKNTSNQSNSILIGIEFELSEYWMKERMRELIDLKNKDHKMMWHLWECYVEEQR